MRAMIVAALLLATPAAADGFDARWHMKDQSRIAQQQPVPVMIHDGDEFTSIDAMAKPLSSVRKDVDICVRNGLRKVMVGRYKWRCR